MNSEERSIYIKYAYDKTFKYIWNVYAEFEIRVNYSPEEYEGIKTGECRFDYDSWETRLSISHKQMVRAIKELTQNDKVLIQKVKGTKGNSSIYFLTRFGEVLKNFEEQKKEQNKEQKQEQKESHNNAVLEGEEEQNKEQNEEQKKVHTSKYTNLSIKSKVIYSEIFDFWNSKKIVVHGELTKEIESAIEKALKKYSKDEIIENINRYSIAINDDGYYFDMKWGLVKFLKQKNAMNDFIESGCKWVEYQNHLKKKSLKNKVIPITRDNKHPYLDASNSAQSNILT